MRRTYVSHIIQKTKQIDKSDFIKLKYFLTAKATARKSKAKQLIGKNNCQLIRRRLISIKHKELIEIIKKKINSAIEQWSKDINKQITEKEIQVAIFNITSSPNER